ncbi:MAG: hypothetical protein IT325_10005 [Anaerolineae bacterium]|nr:hypothetical protein [Anaerolineae bacterium]
MKNANVIARVVVALAVIVGAAYWIINSVRTQTYAGTELEFTMSGGDVVMKNAASGPVMAQFETRGSSASFTITSDNPKQTVRSARSGSGANSVNTAEIELPPGETTLQLARGSNVKLTAQSEEHLEAKVAPVSASTLRLILIVSGVLILGGLYFISAALEHPWKSWLRAGGKTSAAEKRPSM